MAQHVFAGSVSDAGKPAINDMPRYREALRQFAGGRVEFVLRTPKSRRSLDMNAYLHAETGPFRLLAEHFGEDLAGIKLALAGECFGWVYSERFKREIPRRPNTSDWTVEESRYFVDWVRPWAAVNHGVDIPPPNEVL